MSSHTLALWPGVDMIIIPKSLEGAMKAEKFSHLKETTETKKAVAALEEKMKEKKLIILYGKGSTKLAKHYTKNQRVKNKI